MAEQIISASGVQYGLKIDEFGRALVNADGTASSTGSVVYIGEIAPDSDIYTNAIVKLQYSGTVVGSVWKLIPELTPGSYVKVLSYDGTDNLVSVGRWTEVS